MRLTLHMVYKPFCPYSSVSLNLHAVQEKLAASADVANEDGETSQQSCDDRAIM